jgi:predicted dithiol-disulfide oxidoreductase (DUF899 family)
MAKNHKVVSKKEWLAACRKLLEAEKDLTRWSDPPSLRLRRDK